MTIREVNQYLALLVTTPKIVSHMIREGFIHTTARAYLPDPLDLQAFIDAAKLAHDFREESNPPPDNKECLALISRAVNAYIIERYPDPQNKL